MRSPRSSARVVVPKAVSCRPRSPADNLTPILAVVGAPCGRRGMEIREGFIGAIGNPPLIKLRRASELTGCNILGKAEFQNPGGSVKDRAALYVVRDAEQKGLLQPGGTVVEGTAGNTGIGLAHVCRSKGYKCVIFMPDTQVTAITFRILSRI